MSQKRYYSLWILASLALPVHLAASPTALPSTIQTAIREQPPLVLGQGEQRYLCLSGLLKYSIGNRGVRSLSIPRSFSRPENRKECLLLKGVAPGTGDLWVWKQDGSTEHRTLRVEKVHPDEINVNLFKALSYLNEVEVLFLGKGVVLRGEIHSLPESARIASLLKVFPGQVHDESQIHPHLFEEGQRKLDQWLQSSGYSTRLRTEQVGQSLWLRGSTDRPSLAQAIEKQARSIFPLVQTEIDSLPDHAPTVYFRVFLVELKKNHFRNIGLSWPSSAPGAFQVSTGSIKNLLQMDLTLQQLEGTGHARVLSNPELVVRAPGEAELFAGGELPIQMKSRYFSNVTWRNYGLTLRLKVSHVTGERIRLDIFTEVSHLDTSANPDKVPGIQANRMKTQVDARFGVPLLLSGLLQQGQREEVKGLPFLRNIPVLGLLFGSEDYMNERSELVAILYPQSAPPAVPPNSHPENWTKLTPLGPIPPPRNWVNPKDERTLRESKDFPWNALK